MGAVGRGVGEADFQLTRQLHGFDQGHQILCRCLRIWAHIKVLALLHAGKRGYHHISRKISAASAGDDAMIQCCHGKLADRVRIQVMQLNGLTGGEMYLVDVVLTDAVDNKL